MTRDTLEVLHSNCFLQRNTCQRARGLQRSEGEPQSGNPCWICGSCRDVAAIHALIAAFVFATAVEAAERLPRCWLLGWQIDALSRRDVTTASLRNASAKPAPNMNQWPRAQMATNTALAAHIKIARQRSTQMLMRCEQKLCCQLA